ncbi:FecR family protein [Desertivirga arenae]|uniref:FecR family protein n=1 Tax=Desertivirga arenae TaxID=2810309 RepID=UPI001A96DBD2|nr:FecR family protein [Pedobacter sp. SYSU D00823]
MKRVEFERIIDKYIAGKASPQEVEFVNQCLDNFQNGRDSWDSSVMGDQDALGRALFLRTDRRLSSAQKPQVRYLKWFSAAAALLIFLFIGIYQYNSKEGQRLSQSERFKNDIAPASDKATLTLADGSVLNLTDLKEGEVKVENGIRISKRNGQLEYKVTNDQSAKAAYNTITTPRGGKFVILLPDGTKVWLNAASSLHYPTVFKGRERRVQLDGEGYFEVAKNKAKPFHVEADGTEVEVLGTHFNISSYAQDQNFKTTLLEGAVKVSRANNSIVLKPSQQARLSGADGSLLKEPNVDIEEVMAWKDGLFRFKNAELKDIMQEVQRWYDVDVKYEGNLPEAQFTGFISRKVSISSVLKMLEPGVGVQFSLDGRKLVVKSAEPK